MTIERTFSIVKPDAVKRNLIGAIYHRMENAGFKIVAAKMIHMTSEQAQGFYAEHEGKPFFDELVAYMTSGPVMVQVLEGENAVVRYRELMGKTNPEAYVITQFMVPIAQNQQLVKLLTSLLTTRSFLVNVLIYKSKSQS